MKSELFYILFYVLVLNCPVLAEDVTELIRGLEERYNQVGCLSGRIKRVVSIQEERAEIYGNFNYCRPDSFVINYLIPFKKRIVSNGDSMSITLSDSTNVDLTGKFPMLDFNWKMFRPLLDEYNFSYRWRGEIEGYSDVIVLEGGPNKLEEVELPRILLWLDPNNQRLLRFEGYNRKDACVLILTNNQFTKIDGRYIPSDYTIYFPVAEKEKGEIHTILSNLSVLQNGEPTR